MWLTQTHAIPIKSSLNRFQSIFTQIPIQSPLNQIKLLIIFPWLSHSYGHLPVVSTNKTPFIECIIPDHWNNQLQLVPVNGHNYSKQPVNPHSIPLNHIRTTIFHDFPRFSTIFHHFSHAFPTDPPHRRPVVHGLWPQTANFGTSDCERPESAANPTKVYPCGAATERGRGTWKNRGKSHEMPSAMGNY